MKRAPLGRIRIRSPVLTWTYLVLWLSAAMGIFTGMMVFSGYWVRWIRQTDGTYIGQVFVKALRNDEFIGYQNLSASALAERERELEDEIMIKDAALEAGSTVEEGPTEIRTRKPLKLKAVSMFMYVCITLPVAWTGVVAIVLSMFPPIMLLAPTVHSYEKRVRRFVSAKVIANLSRGDMVLVIWYLGVNAAYLSYAFFKQRDVKYSDWKDGPANAYNFSENQYNLLWVAHTLAQVYVVQAPFLFMSVARGSLLTSFLGVKYSVGIKWHRWVGYVTFITILLHGALYNVLLLSAGVLGKVGFRWEYYGVGRERTGASNLAGQVALAAFVVLIGTSFSYIRRNFYKVFYCSHIISAATFLVFSIVHWQDTLGSMYGSLAMYGIDIVYRVVQSYQTVDVFTQVSKDSSIVTMSFKIQDGLEYKDGAEVWVCIPPLGRTQFHPFTVVTTPKMDNTQGHIMVHAKVYNKWTSELAILARLKGVLQARINGPYEGDDVHDEELATYDRILMCVGGVGITSVLGMLRRICEEHRLHGNGSAPIDILYITRHASELQLLTTLLPNAVTPYFKLRIYYTGNTRLRAGFLGKQDFHSIRDLQLELGEELGMSESMLGDRHHVGSLSFMETPHSLLPQYSSRTEQAITWTVTFGIVIIFQALGDTHFQTHKYDTSGYPLIGTAFLSLAYLFSVCLVVPALLTIPLRTIGIALRQYSNALKRVPAAEHPCLGPAIISEIDDEYFLRSTSPGGAGIKIHFGRPDITRILNEIMATMALPTDPGSRMAGVRKPFVGVWLAGPRKLNSDFAKAVNRQPVTADVHTMTHEL